MKFKATDFRAVCYGVAAICTGVAALHQTGLIDKAIDEGKHIANKFKKDKKSKPYVDNEIIQQALDRTYRDYQKTADETYYSECFNKGKKYRK